MCGRSHAPQINHTPLWTALYLRYSRGQIKDCWRPSDLVFGPLKGVLGRWKVIWLLGSHVQERQALYHLYQQKKLRRGFEISAVSENKKWSYAWRNTYAGNTVTLIWLPLQLNCHCYTRNEGHKIYLLHTDVRKTTTQFLLYNVSLCPRMDLFTQGWAIWQYNIYSISW